MIYFHDTQFFFKRILNFHLFILNYTNKHLIGWSTGSFRCCLHEHQIPYTTNEVRSSTWNSIYSIYGFGI